MGYNNDKRTAQIKTKMAILNQKQGENGKEIERVNRTLCLKSNY